MDLDPFVAGVTDQLTATAALGDDRTRQIAAALGASAVDAIRLAMINVIASAVDDVNTALLARTESSGFGVSVHVANGEPVIGIHQAPDAAANPVEDHGDGEASARISLRLSEALKADVDAAASAASVSVNTWLVRAARAGLDPGNGSRTTRSQHHIRGWVVG